ncbi:hypothetical protein [Rubripirellula tenax]|nr:hypothetical protein [Rubripirellula tenax]
MATDTITAVEPWHSRNVPVTPMPPQSASKPVENGSAANRPKPTRRERLVDLLTPEQRAVNRRLMEAPSHEAVGNDETGSELRQLSVDLAVMEKSLREKSTTIKSLSQQLERASGEKESAVSELFLQIKNRDADTERIGAFIAGYEALLAKRDQEYSDIERELEKVRRESSTRLKTLESGLAAEARRKRGSDEAAEMATASMADQVRRWQKRMSAQSAEHAKQLASLQREADEARQQWANRTRMQAASESLQSENLRTAEERCEELTRRMNEAMTRVTETDAALRQLQRDRAADLSRTEIEVNVLRAQLESSVTKNSELGIRFAEVVAENEILKSEVGDAESFVDEVSGTSERLRSELEMTKRLLELSEREAFRWRAEAQRGRVDATSLSARSQWSATESDAWQREAFRWRAKALRHQADALTILARKQKESFESNVWEAEAFRFHSAWVQACEVADGLQLDVDSLDELSARQAESHANQMDDLHVRMTGDHDNLKLALGETESATDQLRDRSEQLQRLQGVLAQCRGELAESSRAHQAAVNDLEAKSAELERLASQFESVRSSAGASQADLVTLRTDLATAKADLLARENELTIIRSDYLAKQSECESACTDIDSLRMELSRTQTELTENWKLSESVTDRLQRQEATLERMQEQERRLIEIQNSEFLSFQNRINELQNTVEELTEELDQQRQQRSETASEAGQLQIQRDDLIEQMQLLREQSDAQAKDLAQLAQVAASAQSSQTETARLRARLSAGQARGKLLIEHYRSRLKAAGEQLDRCQQELRRLRNATARRAA